MLYLREYYFDYDPKIPKQLNHIQSKYNKMRKCLDSGKLQGEGSDLARGYKVFMKFIDDTANTIQDGLVCDMSYYYKKKYHDSCINNEIIYYEGDFKDIPVMLTSREALKIQAEHLKNESESFEVVAPPSSESVQDKVASPSIEDKQEEEEEEEEDEDEDEEEVAPPTTDNLSEQDKRFLKQIKNLEKKIKEQEEENFRIETNINTEEKHFEKLKKKYHAACHERNKMDLLLEKPEKELKEEFSKYKDFYKKYQEKVEALEK